MAPEYGATIGFFPVDDETLAYLRLSPAATPTQVALVEAYCKEQGLFRTADTPEPDVHRHARARPRTVEPSLAGPKRPQDRVAAAHREGVVADGAGRLPEGQAGDRDSSACRSRWTAQRGELGHGSVVIAAITSCTNTSNPSVMLAAGLLAQKAVERGLRVEAVGEDEPRARLEGGDRYLAGRRR